jgi:MFS family permease
VSDLAIERAGRRRVIIPPFLRDNVGFRRLWAGQTISLFGDQVSLLAFPLVAVLALHAGAAEMGYLVAAQMAPNIVFALHAGAWVDRYRHHRAVMITADTGRAVILLSVPAAFELGGLTIEQLYVVGFAIGTLTVLFRVSYPSLVTALVPRRDFVFANQWTNGSRALSYVAGPSLGGLLVQTLSGPVAIVADALSYAGSAVFVGRTGVSAGGAPDGPAGEGTGGLATGLRLIWRDPLLRPSLVASAVVNVFSYAVLAVFILYLTRSLHIGPGSLGLVLGGGAVGGVVGSLLTGSVSRRFGVGPAYIAGMFLFPLPILLVPAAGGPRPLVYAMVFLAEFVSGFGVMLLDILGGSLFQAVVPDNLRARFMGAFTFVNYGVRPVGGLLGGVAGTMIGLRNTLWLATAGAVLGGFFLLCSPTRRVRDLPEECSIQHIAE